MNDCTTFRRALADALSAARGVPPALGWHEHVLTCADCRDLLAAEEALEELLRSLPEPRLPRELTRRVLAALTAARGTTAARGDERLESLLALDHAADVPHDLARRVLAGLAPARHAGTRDAERAERAERNGDERNQDRRLDALLDAVPAPAVPAGLAERVLARLEGERDARVVRGRLVPLRAWAAAAAVLLAAALLFAWRRSASSESPTGSVESPPVSSGAPASPGASTRGAGASSDDPQRAPRRADPFADLDPELLASLDLLENWDALTSDDLDLLLDELDEVDLALLEYLPNAEGGG